MLHRIATLEAVDSSERATDAELVAYREQRLDRAAAQRVERLLGSSREARERLAALSGLDTPSAELRSRLLSMRNDDWRRWFDRRLVVAAVLGICVCAPTVWWMTRQSAEHAVSLSGMSFDVQVNASATRRSHGDATTALLSTPVSIDVSPIGVAVPGLEFGLYRVDGLQLRRLSKSDGMKLEERDGAARLTVRAEQLAGSLPNTYPFVVAVAPRGSLPDVATIGAGDSPEAALRFLPNTLAYRRDLKIEVPPSQPTQIDPPTRR